MKFVAYDTYRNSGDFSSPPELRRNCTCLHFKTEAEARAEYQRLIDWYSEELEARRVAMLA